MRRYYGLRLFRKAILALMMLIAVSSATYSREERSNASSTDWDNPGR